MPPARTIIVELTMATPVGAQVTAQPSGLVAISRAVVSAAADLVVSVERAMVGDDNIRTARGNAWDAMCADRARAQARDEIDQLVRTLRRTRPRPAGQRAVGSSPRSMGVPEGSRVSPRGFALIDRAAGRRQFQWPSGGLAASSARRPVTARFVRLARPVAAGPGVVRTGRPWPASRWPCRAAPRPPATISAPPTTQAIGPRSRSSRRPGVEAGPAVIAATTTPRPPP